MSNDSISSSSLPSLTDPMSAAAGPTVDAGLLAELREIFDAFDRNKDGSLTELELASLLRSLGLSPTPDQLESLIRRADANFNGLIEFLEFVNLVAPELQNAAASCPYTDDELRRLFRLFDRDGDGYITAAELTHSMARLGRLLTVGELTGMIREADLDGDGRISFEEFATVISAAAADGSASWFD